jgi:hypothetical protein
MNEAQNRGDFHGYANLFFQAMPLLNMAADGVEEGHQELSEEMECWAKKGLYVNHSASLYMKSSMLLYLHKEREGEQAAIRMLCSMRELRLMIIQHMRIATRELMGRIQIAVAWTEKNPASYLKAAERTAVRLAREKRPDARSLAKLIRAGIANRKGDLDKTKQLLEEALSGLTACELGLFAAAARRRLGQLIGGDQGKALITEADRWMTAQGIRKPHRMAAVYAPGFADP